MEELEVLLLASAKGRTIPELLKRGTCDLLASACS